VAGARSCLSGQTGFSKEIGTKQTILGSSKEIFSRKIIKDFQKYVNNFKKSEKRHLLLEKCIVFTSRVMFFYFQIIEVTKEQA